MKCSEELTTVLGLAFIRKEVLTVCDIDPLFFLPVALLVLKLEVYVGLPRYIRIVDHNIATLRKILFATQHIGVIKYRFGNKTARYRHLFRVQQRHLIISKLFVHVLVRDDWVTLLCCIFEFDFFAHKLFVAAGLDVASVILVKITEFVININRSKHLLFNDNFLAANFTLAVRRRANCIILHLDHLNAIRHHIKSDPERQEDNPKHYEDGHSASVAGDWAPSW